MAKLKTAKKFPPIEQLRSRTLGRVLIKMGILTREKVHECLKIQKQWQETVQIGQILIFGFEYFRPCSDLQLQNNFLFVKRYPWISNPIFAIIAKRINDLLIYCKGNY